MNTDNRVYIAIDLKSFYASVECMERGLDPLCTNLVVADESRTAKTICLAVSPSLKAYGIPGRARLFEVISKVKDANAVRRAKLNGKEFEGSSSDANELESHPEYAIDYIVARPQMAHYMECSTQIYNIYLKYIAPEDIHVYSIDEVIMDVTAYLHSYGLTPYELAMTMIRDVLKNTGITATAGIGTNMYLAKIAMDIVAKHMPADEDGVRIAEINERRYREKLWAHQPITDFWRVGKGIAKKLKDVGIYTMGDVARCSIGKETDFYNEDLLYKMFGVNAELLIDHAWGYEPTIISDVKAYKPENSSLCSGQVLQEAYDYKKSRMVVREMAEGIAFDMFMKGLVADQMILTIEYDRENLTDPAIANEYKGEITLDRYGRKVPKHAHGSVNLKDFTASEMIIRDALVELFENIINPRLLTRRFYITANHVIPKDMAQKKKEESFEQMDIFSFCEQSIKKSSADEEKLKREEKMQQAMLDIKKRYGKNAILKGSNLLDGATAKERNSRIGGHRA